MFGEEERSSGVVAQREAATCVKDGRATESGLETRAVPTIRNAGIPEEQPQLSFSAVPDGGPE